MLLMGVSFQTFRLWSRGTGYNEECPLEFYQWKLWKTDKKQQTTDWMRGNFFINGFLSFQKTNCFRQFWKYIFSSRKSLARKIDFLRDSKMKNAVVISRAAFKIFNEIVSVLDWRKTEQAFCCILNKDQSILNFRRNKEENAWCVQKKRIRPLTFE